jgi:glycosyltransferase involved in cell wall biosynthesis
MNVAIFTDNDFEKVNGVTTTLRAVLKFAPSDLHARVYTAGRAVARPDYLSLRSPGVNIPFYRGMRMYLPRFLAYVSHAKRDRIDLVHYTTPGPVGLAAMYVASRLGLPMVGSFHTQLAEYTELLSGSARLGNLMREYMRWPYSRCERILVPSETTRQLLVSAKIRPEKIRIWTRGVDTLRFTSEARDESLRREWDVSDRKPAVLYVGRISREKGLAIVPALARGLADAGLAARFVFVGDGPMRNELQAACPDACFLGERPHDDVPRLMASADMFLFPSRTDTLGNVVLEAQACGLPVLVSDAGGPRENITVGASGFVCSETGPESFDARLATLVGNAALRHDMGHAARAYALERRWERALAPLYDTWREIGLRTHAPAALLAPVL